MIAWVVIRKCSCTKTSHCGALFVTYEEDIYSQALINMCSVCKYIINAKTCNHPNHISIQPGSFDSDEEKFYAVELHRGSRGFGFSIRGGQEFNSMPLYVLRIADGGAADLDGRLRVK